MQRFPWQRHEVAAKKSRVQPGWGDDASKRTGYCIYINRKHQKPKVLYIIHDCSFVFYFWYNTTYKSTEYAIKYEYFYTVYIYIHNIYIHINKLDMTFRESRFRSWWLVHVGALEVPKQLKLMWMMWSTRAILGSAWRKKQMVEPKFNAHAVYRYLYIYMSFDKKYAQQISTYVKSSSLHRFTCCILKQKVVVATWTWPMEAADAPLENPAPGHSVGNPNTPTKPNLFETH